MEGKKSFVLYTELIHTVRKMPQDKQAKLFMTILEYVNDENPDVEDDILIALVFEPIKHSLKRDLVKWKVKAIKNAENGALGGRPKKDEKPVIEVDDRSFDEVWSLYDKKRGDIEKLKRKWIKISQADKALIMEYIPKYKAATPDRQYRKDLSTFLNNKGWLDEIITSNTNKNGTHQTASDRTDASIDELFGKRNG